MNKKYTLYYKMWAYVLQNIVLSILVVLLSQYLWDYFKLNYSTRKTKDVVDFQTKKYREILKNIHDTSTSPNTPSTDMYISSEEKEKMIHELLSFIEITDNSNA